MWKDSLTREEGQGLVEYALILVLVGIVVIVILALLGPAVGNVFSNVVAALEEVAGGGGGGTITGASASWAGADIVINVIVSEQTVVSASIVSGSGGGPFPSSQTCNPDSACKFTVTGASANGAVKVTGGGGYKKASW